MRVCVVTPYHRPDPAWIAQCHASVRAQTHPCTHLLVSDGGAPHTLDDFQGQHIALNHGHADWGDTPRAIGSLSAASQGFDAVAWLDDDNWFHPTHIESLVQLHRETGAPVCTSTRDIHHVDGRRLGRCAEIDGQVFVDTNCFLVTRAAFALVGVWALMPQQYHLVGDKYLCAMIRKSGFGMAHTGLPTVAYRATRSIYYDEMKLERPPGVTDVVEFTQKMREARILICRAPGSGAPYLEI